MNFPKKYESCISINLILTLSKVRVETQKFTEDLQHRHGHGQGKPRGEF